MKTLFICILLSCFSCMSINAQEVYNSIHSKAKEVVDNPASEGIVKQLNQFKLDALDYLFIKMREEMPDSTTAFLDKEAFALNNFMNLYTRMILEQRNEPKVFTVEIIKIFMDASYSNPLFDDSDKDLVLSYYNNGDSMTRFSLDTDWRRAFIAASFKMKEWKEKNNMPQK